MSGLEQATNINAALPPWVPSALQATERLFRAFEPPLSDRMARVADRLSQRNGATTIEAGLRASVATPFLAAMDALRQDYRIAADNPCMPRLGEATLALYIYVRIQDDIVDEPDEIDRADVFVMEVFHGASQRAFARALDGNPTFFAFQEEVMDRFAGAALWEVDAFHSAASAEIDLVQTGQKFLPMAVPLGAVALLAQRSIHLPRIAEFVTHLGTGLQMVNDVLNVRQDHANKRLTPVLKWLYADEAQFEDDTSTRIRLKLLASEVLYRALDRARAALRNAERIAQDMDAPKLAAVAANRAEFVQSVTSRLLALHLGVNEL
jgi:hypothetical protein